MAAVDTGGNSDMEIENNTNHPKKNEVELGADFIGFEVSDHEDEPSKTGRPPQKGATNRHINSLTTESHGGKRKRPVDEDDDPDEGPITGPPPGCPWMGHRNYSKMASVPIMLTQELLDFVDYISPTKEEHQIRDYVVRLIQKTVRTLWPNADVVVFGSFDTMLYLPTSDLDIVLLREGGLLKSDLSRLASHLRRSGIANDITVISKARVPLVKFKESITGIPVDISFNITNGIDSGQVISAFINEIPALRPLTMLVKYFLMTKNHNEVYLGGIGSYTTVIMILSFLQMHPQIQVNNIDPMDNLGVLLIEFFELYGLCFNYSRVGLTVRDSGSYFEKRDIPTNNRPSFGRSGQGQELLLTCIDPNDPSNDTAKGSYSLRKIREVFVGAYGALTQAVQNRHRELFINDKRVSSSHVRFDGRNRVAADSKQKSSGLHRSSQVSLIREVYQVPTYIVQHRQKIAKVFLDGTYQVIFGDPIVSSLDLKSTHSTEDDLVKSAKPTKPTKPAKTTAEHELQSSKQTEAGTAGQGQGGKTNEDRITFKGMGDRIEFKGAAAKHKKEQEPVDDELELAMTLGSDNTPFDDKKAPAMNAQLRETIQMYKTWDVKDESCIPKLVSSMQQLVRFHTLKKKAYLDKKQQPQQSPDKMETAFVEAREMVRARLMEFCPPAEAKEKMRILVEATRRQAREYAEKNGRTIGKNAPAKRTGSLKDVEFVQEESDEEGEYFEDLMRQGAEEYGDSDENDEPTEGGRGTGTAGHRNPNNVNASEGSIQLPQLYSRKN